MTGIAKNLLKVFISNRVSLELKNKLARKLIQILWSLFYAPLSDFIYAPWTKSCDNVQSFEAMKLKDSVCFSSYETQNIVLKIGEVYSIQ